MGLDESGLQLGHLLRSGDTDAVVLGHSGIHAGHLEWNDVGEETILLGAVGHLVRTHGVLVLLLATHVERGSQTVGRVTHGLICRELGNGRQLEIFKLYYELEFFNLVRGLPRGQRSLV